MSNLYWASIAAAVLFLLLSTVEHFGAFFLLPIASARGFLNLTELSLLFAIAFAVGSLVQQQRAQESPAGPETSE